MMRARPAAIAAVCDPDRPLPAFADPVSRRRGALQATRFELQQRRRDAVRRRDLMAEWQATSERRIENLDLQLRAVEEELAELGGGAHDATR